MKKSKKSFYFSPVFVRQGGGSHGKNYFFPIEVGKFCLREGDCVFGGLPMGIPPVPLPLPMCDPEGDQIEVSCVYGGVTQVLGRWSDGVPCYTRCAY